MTLLELTFSTYFPIILAGPIMFILNRTSIISHVYLLIHPIYTHSSVLARLLTALVDVDFTSLSLETGRTGAIEATGVVMATAAAETWLWLTLINIDLTGDPCEFQKTQMIQEVDTGQRVEIKKSFHVDGLWSYCFIYRCLTLWAVCFTPGTAVYCTYKVMLNIYT